MERLPAIPNLSDVFTQTRQQKDNRGANAEAERTKLRSRDCKGANAKLRKPDNDGTKCRKAFRKLRALFCAGGVMTYDQTSEGE